MDFTFFFDPPVHSVHLTLEIDSLSPLSMASGQPGNYYQSLRIPTYHMLYGMLENALGWHFAEDIRKDIFKAMQKTAKKKFRKDAQWASSDWLNAIPESSGVKYFSFLQFHLTFDGPKQEPRVNTYDDLWAQSLRDSGRSFFGGSRHYDALLENVINRVRKGEIEFGDRSEFKDVSLEELDKLPIDAKINYRAIRSLFPQYYTSLPTIREYIEPEEPYVFDIHTTEAVSAKIIKAIENPEAPLYLGANDGWVEAKIIRP